MKITYFREIAKNWAEDLTELDDQDQSPPKRQRFSFLQSLQSQKPKGHFKNLDENEPKIVAYNLETSMEKQLEEQEFPKSWAKELIEYYIIKCLFFELRKIVGAASAKRFTDKMMNALNIHFNGMYIF